MGELITHVVTSGGRQYRAASLRDYERLEERDGMRAVLQEWHCEAP